MLMDRHAHMNFVGRAQLQHSLFLWRQMSEDYKIDVDTAQFLKAVTYETEDGRRVSLDAWDAAPGLGSPTEVRTTSQRTFTRYFKKVSKFIPAYAKRWRKTFSTTENDIIDDGEDEDDGEEVSSQDGRSSQSGVFRLKVAETIGMARSSEDGHEEAEVEEESAQSGSDDEEVTDPLTILSAADDEVEEQLEHEKGLGDELASIEVQQKGKEDAVASMHDDKEEGQGMMQCDETDVGEDTVDSEDEYAVEAALGLENRDLTGA